MKRARTAEDVRQQLLERRSANQLIDIKAHARDGNFQPLADYLENGGDLSPEYREVVVRALRGQFKKPPHRARTWAQIKAEEEVITRLQWLLAEAIVNGESMTRNKLVERYLQEDPEASKATVLKWVENYEIQTGARLPPPIK